MRNNLFPSPIVVRAEAKQMQAELFMAKQQAQTVEEYIYHLTHKVNNSKHEDGRIYMFLTEGGELFANSVSPFSEKFWENVEPKIKPIVEVLVNKRYLPYSSCEGHGFTFRRYVGLAFADKASRQYVADYIMNFKIPGVKVNLLNSVANQKIDQSYKSKVKYTEKYDATKVDQKEQETLTFNIQFHRSYEEYFFLEIVILDPVEFGWSVFKNPIRNLWLWYMKKYRWDLITEKLLIKLKDDGFKKYRY